MTSQDSQAHNKSEICQDDEKIILPKVLKRPKKINDMSLEEREKIIQDIKNGIVSEHYDVKTYKNGNKAEAVWITLHTSTKTLGPGVFKYLPVGTNPGTGKIHFLTYDISGGSSALFIDKDFISGTIEINSVTGNNYDIFISLNTTYGNTVTVTYNGVLR